VSGIDPIVVLIGLGAGGIAAILLRALFREMGTRPVGRQAVWTVQASGSLAHEQSDTTGSSPPPQNFPPHVTPGLPVPGADERRINT